MTDHPQIPFPCDRVPADPGAARLVGLYPQRQEGLWMQRVKVLGGVLTGEQWRALAGAAGQSRPSAPLHLTTRQDIELHNLTAGQVPAVQQAVAGCGLTAIGACGDTLRNLTVCPCSGVRPGSVDLVPLAWQIRRTLEGLEGIFSLPRKFKIALACGESCGQPWINDLGLTAARQNGRWGFRVAVAGSLGARPGTGILLFDWLPAADVLPLTVAAIRVFAEQGDRQDRRRARLRHVRERMGDEAFTELLRKAFPSARAERDWPEAPLPAAETALPAEATLTFANGDVSPEAAEALGQLADDARFRVRIANQHRVIVFGPDDAAVADALAAMPVLREAARPQASVVACPGSRWCARAIVQTNALADRIRAELGDRLTPETTVCISGCPNGCSHAAVADFGLTGCLATRDGERTEAFNLLIGGRMGRGKKLAEPDGKRLSPDEAVRRIAELAGRLPT